MSVRKNLVALVAVSILGVSNTIQSINPSADEVLVGQSEVPLLSPKQLSKQMNDFRRYLNRVRRCMFTGPCTKEEIAQVRRHALKLLKAMGWAGAAMALYYVSPMLKQKALEGAKATKELAQQAVEETVKKAVQTALAEVKGTVPDAVEAVVQKAVQTALKEVGTTVPDLAEEVVEKAVRKALAEVEGFGVSAVYGRMGVPIGVKLGKEPAVSPAEARKEKEESEEGGLREEGLGWYGL